METMQFTVVEGEGHAREGRPEGGREGVNPGGGKDSVKRGGGTLNSWLERRCKTVDSHNL